jgi:hypothetical protein
MKIFKHFLCGGVFSFLKLALNAQGLLLFRKLKTSRWNISPFEILIFNHIWKYGTAATAPDCKSGIPHGGSSPSTSTN